jgi:arginine/lysine/ornithine decarboxylase
LKYVADKSNKLCKETQKLYNKNMDRHYGVNETKENGTEIQTSLFRRIKEYGEGGVYPFHMPGHKRNTEAFSELKELGGDVDISEIDAFDNLHDAKGIIAQSQRLAAQALGVREAFYLVNGSTGGMLAAVRALSGRGDGVIVARNCHKSVYNAVSLNCLNAEYVYPDTAEIDGAMLYASVSPSAVEELLKRANGDPINLANCEPLNPAKGLLNCVNGEFINSATANGESLNPVKGEFSNNANDDPINSAKYKPMYHAKGEPLKPSDNQAYNTLNGESINREASKKNRISLVIITSPTYEGVISDVRAIAEVSHRYGAKLIVDEAHGAHLGLDSGFLNSARSCGADVVINSLHKTLSALTQSALLSVPFGSLCTKDDIRSLKSQLAVFETSSPSYVLLSSMDACIRRIACEKQEYFSRWSGALDKFHTECASLQNLIVLSQKLLGNAVYGFDKSKIVVIPKPCIEKDGVRLSRELRAMGIEIEMASAAYIIAMTGAGDTEASLDKLKSALFTIDGQASFGRSKHASDMQASNMHASDMQASDMQASDMQASDLSAKTEAYCGIVGIKPVVACPAWEAEEKERERIALCEADGSVSAEYIWAYPPGCPLIVPGERLNFRMLERLAHLSERGIAVSGSLSDFPNEIAVLKRQ